MKTDCAFGVVKDRFFGNGIARKLARMKLFLFLASVSAFKVKVTVVNVLFGATFYFDENHKRESSNVKVFC